MSRPSSREGERGVRGDKSHSLNGILRMKNPFASADFLVRRTLFSERNLFPRLLALAALGLLLVPLPAEAKPKAALVQTAVIENTGSTNTTGYRLEISSDGSVKRGLHNRNASNWCYGRTGICPGCR